MERIQPRKRTGISAHGLRLWGLLFVLIGIVGRTIVQNRLLGMHNMNTQELLSLLESSENMMTFATYGLVMQALETCAVPIFAFLLVEGIQHTANFPKYLLRVVGTAVLSELPFNLAVSGKLLDFSSRNPVFGLLIAMFVINLYGRYPGKSFKAVAMKALITLCGLLWCSMLSVEYGARVVLISVTLWAFRAKPSVRNMAGACVTLLCSLSSMFFMAAPMGFLAIFIYNGEPDDLNPKVKYLIYPAALLAVFLVGVFFFR